MLQPPSCSLAFMLILGCLSTFCFTLGHSQTAQPGLNAPVIFHANAQTVILDVIVTGQNGKPVEGLHQEEFLLAEDGHPQTITSFEEHTGNQSVQVAAAELPPNLFTNVPRVNPTDSVTILLIDFLNTPSEHLSTVRNQLLNYIKQLKPGRPVAIFALGTRLRLLQGITTDPGLLTKALTNQKSGTPLLWSSEDMDMDVDKFVEPFNHNTPFLKQLQADEKADQTDILVTATLEELQELARSLAGVPGRKNVVWLSDAFPSIVFADSSLIKPSSVARDYEGDLQKTDALLTAGQVAIYPVAAEGLATGVIDIDQELSPTGNTQQLLDSKQQREALRRNAYQATMDQIAKETGGIAFYSANGINDALARVMEHGSHFYTLTYTPANSQPDGRYRKIEVKLASDRYKLAYRPGYYAAGGKAVPAGSGDQSLHPFMHKGMPDSTQIHFALQVQPQPRSDLDKSRARAGDNDKLKGPLTRYTVEFGIAVQDLRLDSASDGTHRGKVALRLVVYDKDGKALNWIIKDVNLHMDAVRYKWVQVNGVHFPIEIDVPKSAAYLQTGIYDHLTGQTGTLEIPLSSVVTRQAASLKPQ